MTSPMPKTRRGRAQASDAPKKGETEGLVRLNVNLNAETAAALREMATEKGISFTEAVRRAIAISKFIDDEINEGRKIQTLTKENDAVRELVLF
jgi:hypothetical protein